MLFRRLRELNCGDLIISKIPQPRELISFLSQKSLNFSVFSQSMTRKPNGLLARKGNLAIINLYQSKENLSHLSSAAGGFPDRICHMQAKFMATRLPIGEFTVELATPAVQQSVMTMDDAC